MALFSDEYNNTSLVPDDFTHTCNKYACIYNCRYSPIANADLALATSSFVNPFAPPHSQLSSHQLGAHHHHHLGDHQSAAALASAASMLPSMFNAATKATSTFITGLGGGPSSSVSRIGSGVGGDTSGLMVEPSALDQHAHRLAAATGQLSGWCLFVYNLAPEVEENVIWKLFGPFGAVQQVNLVKDAQTNKCRGFAFVTMSDYNQALMAIQSLNGSTLANRVLQVSFKTSKVRKTMQ